MIRTIWPWPKKRKTAIQTDQSQRRSSRTNQKCFEKICTSRNSNLHSSDLRMVIMDNDSSRRASKRVIYDSSTIVPLLPGEIIAPDTRVSECKKFRLLRKKKDVSNLAQMVWGSGPASHAAVALKFHHLNDDRLLISRVFAMPRSVHKDIYNQTESINSSDSESQYTPTVRSIDTYGLSVKSGLSSTAPPEKFSRVRNSSLNIESDESDEFRAFSPPHRLSKNRRIQMTHSASLCEPATSPLHIRIPRSRMSSIGSQPDDGNSSGGSQPFGSQGDERQVALAIVFSHTQRSFVFQHIPLIESEMSRLEGRITNAALYSKNFLDNVYRAWEEFNISICMLFNAPRLRNPAWLSLTEKQPDLDEHTFSVDFVDQMARMVKRLDTKDTNYFLSNLVSTILMYHMSWVASVAAPYGSSSDFPTIRIHHHLLENAEEEFQSVPYNPHYAQFLEINGNVGNINRNTKTVVCGAGEDAEMITLLLQILSYFIRCSAVQASKRGRETDPLPVFRSFSPEMIGSPASSTSDLAAFSPERVREIEYEVPGYMEPPNLLVNNVSKTDAIDSVDYLGRSLLAGPSTTFSPHFIISGLLREGTNFDKAFESMYDEMQLVYDGGTIQRAHSSMSCSQTSSYYEPCSGPDAVMVMADVADNSVKILTPQGIGIAHTPSETVVSMFENFTQLHEIGTAPKFLIEYLENSLGSVLGKSLCLVEMVSGAPDSNRITSPHFSPDRVRHVVGCDHSDLRLILNVASVYYPCVLSSVS